MFFKKNISPFSFFLPLTSIHHPPTPRPRPAGLKKSKKKKTFPSQSSRRHWSNNALEDFWRFFFFGWWWNDGGRIGNYSFHRGWIPFSLIAPPSWSLVTITSVNQLIIGSEHFIKDTILSIVDWANERRIYRAATKKIQGYHNEFIISSTCAFLEPFSISKSGIGNCFTKRGDGPKKEIFRRSTNFLDFWSIQSLPEGTVSRANFEWMFPVYFFFFFCKSESIKRGLTAFASVHVPFADLQREMIEHQRFDHHICKRSHIYNPLDLYLTHILIR